MLTLAGYLYWDHVVQAAGEEQVSLAPEYDLSRSSAAARVPWCYLLNWESLGGAESEQSGQTRARGIHIKYPLKEHNRAFAFILDRYSYWQLIGLMQHTTCNKFNLKYIYKKYLRKKYLQKISTKSIYKRYLHKKYLKIKYKSNLGEYCLFIMLAYRNSLNACCYKTFSYCIWFTVRRLFQFFYISMMKVMSVLYF